MRDPSSARPEPPGLPKVGEVVAQRYAIERFIDRGGMSHVFEARHTALGSVLALKVLDPKVFQGVQDAQVRFAREARLASRLRHPSIVEVFDIGMTESGLPFIAMELLDGPSLSKILREQAPLGWPRAKEFILQILDALQVAHAAGAVHRDVKPDNCLVVEGTEHLKLLDFGIARVLHETQVTVAGTMMGTPHYLSPEQARGAQTDARTDVYSAGIVLYEMLTGHCPFEQGTTFEIVGAHIKEPPPPLSSLIDVSHLPAGLPELLDRVLAKDPAFRPADGGSFAAELRALDTGAPALWKRPAVWAGAAAAAFGIGLATVGLIAAASDDAAELDPVLVASAPVFEVPAIAQPTPVAPTKPAPEVVDAEPTLPAVPVSEPVVVVEDEPAVVPEEPRRKRGGGRKRKVARALRKAAASCAKFAPPGGAKVAVRAEVTASGSVRGVQVKPPYSGSVLGRCVARAVDQASVGAGAPVIFDQRVRIGG